MRNIMDPANKAIKTAILTIYKYLKQKINTMRR